MMGLYCDFGAGDIECMKCVNDCPTDAIQIGEMTRGTVRNKKVKIPL